MIFVTVTYWRWSSPVPGRRRGRVRGGVPLAIEDPVVPLSHHLAIGDIGGLIEEASDLITTGVFGLIHGCVSSEK